MTAGPIAGVVLAGGLARRMGGEKAMLPLHGKPLLAHVVERAKTQVGVLAINANEAGDIRGFGCEIVPDILEGYLGPLAGVMAGLAWASREHDAKWLVTFACDTPFFPVDVAPRLVAQAETRDVQIAVASDGVRHYPTFAAWHVDLLEPIEDALTKQAIHKMDDFISLHPNVRVPFDPANDPFFNINTPDDLKIAEAKTAHG